MKDNQLWSDSTIKHLLAMAYMDGWQDATNEDSDIRELVNIAKEKAEKAFESKSSEVYR